MIKVKAKFYSLLVLLAMVGCSSQPKQVEKQEEEKPAVAEEAKKPEPVEKVKPAEPKVVEQKKPAPVVEEKKEPPKPVVVKKPEPKPEPKVEPVKKVEPKKVAKPAPVSTDPNTFIVVTEMKTESHPDFGKGANHGFTVNGEQGKDLVVVRGEEYTFKVDTGVKHDFYLTTNPVGWGTATYSEGVVGQFTYSGDVGFKPSVGTPDVLFYQCRNHKSMGGKIYVLDKGEDLAAVKAKVDRALAAKKSTRATKTQAADERTVKQKISYANMLLMGGNIKKLEASGNEQALGKLNDAKASIADAKKLMASGSYDEALKKANAGIRLVMTASMAAASSQPKVVDNSAQRAEYDELTNALKTYESSYERNVKRAKKSGQKLKATLNKDKYNQLVAQGKSSADGGDYVAANKSLQEAQMMITNTLTAMLQSQTVVYDKNFETPKEEYEYELARTESYEELIPLAIEQRQPSKGLMMLMNTYVDKAKKIKAEGLEIVKNKKDYKMGIMAMQAATDNLIRALRAVGVQ